MSKNNKEIKIKLKKLDERAVIPTYAHNGDVGMDMTAIDVEYDKEHDMYIYHTGLAFESDMNIGQFLFPRSSNRKTDAYLCNSVGIADSAIYRGEILFCYKNRDSLKTKALLNGLEDACEYLRIKVLGAKRSLWTRFKNPSNPTILQIASNLFEKGKDEILESPLAFAPYKVGERIGQMVFMNYPTVNIEIVDELSSSDRGENGFGSTGA